MTEVRAEEIRNRVKAEFDNHSYYVRKDLDAINEGSDFVENPEASWVATHVLDELGIEDDFDDEAFEVYNAVAEIFKEIQAEIEEINEEEWD